MCGMKTFLAAAIPLAMAVSNALGGWVTGESIPLADPSKGLSVWEIPARNSDRSATLTAIIFNSRHYTLRVVDSPSPGVSKLAAVMAEGGFAAGVNGGYFHDDFRPVGLVISEGKEIHRFEKAKLLSGIVEVRKGRIGIVRSSQFQPSTSVTEALQCGPMLVDRGAAVAGLNDERRARRTIVATDGEGRWALIYLTSVTLADAAQILTAAEWPAGWTTSKALNLDGGSSSGLWANAAPSPVTRPEFGHVRNFLAVVPAK
jgi:uncharacterized protein YigE (DUF2233 family)